MSNDSPKSRIAPVAVLHRVVFYALLCYALYPYEGMLSFVYAFFIQLVVAYGLKFVFIPGSSFTAWTRLRQGRYEEAIEYFKKDVEYYTRRGWIDYYRFSLMISWSNTSFKEVALCGIGYCLIQIGRVKEAREVYVGILEEYPGCEAARRSLNTIDMIQKGD